MYHHRGTEDTKGYSTFQVLDIASSTITSTFFVLDVSNSTIALVSLMMMVAFAMS
jgi:hypothetical protein